MQRVMLKPPYLVLNVPVHSVIVRDENSHLQTILPSSSSTTVVRAAPEWVTLVINSISNNIKYCISAEYLSESNYSFCSGLGV